MFGGWSSTTRTWTGVVRLGHRSPPRAEEVADLLREAAHADRLLDVAVEAGRERALAVLVHREGGHRHDRDVLAVAADPDLTQRLGAVDAGQLEVHQDQVAVAPSRASRTPSSPVVASMTS